MLHVFDRKLKIKEVFFGVTEIETKSFAYQSRNGFKIPNLGNLTDQPTIEII